MTHVPTLALALATIGSLTACGDRVVTVPAPNTTVPGTLTVTGTATLEVSPDCADLTMTLSADDPKPGAATHALADRQAALVAALAKVGVERRDITLSLLTMNPIYDRDSDGTWSQQRVRTYRAEVTVTATTRKFDQIGELMDAGANAGVSHMASAFRRSDLPELKKKVRDMAIAAASAKAAQTADGLHLTLGRITHVAEAQGGSLWGYSNVAQVSNSTAAFPGSGSTALGASLQPLTLDITIGYELPLTI